MVDWMVLENVHRFFSTSVLGIYLNMGFSGRRLFWHIGEHKMYLQMVMNPQGTNYGFSIGSEDLLSHFKYNRCNYEGIKLQGST